MRARDAAQRGDLTSALGVMAEALTAHPDHARLWHYAGNLLLQSGNAAEAADRFGKAFALEPGNPDFAIDQAIAMSGDGQYSAALKLLATVEGVGQNKASYWSTRANAARGAGDLQSAATWFDKALSLEPARARALQGRAKVALERGETDAVARYDAALNANPADADTWLGKAQALDVAGRFEEARQLAETLVEQLPQWTDALHFLSQMRLGMGEKDFSAPYRNAAQRLPGNAEISIAHCKELVSLDLLDEAAEVAEEASKRLPDEPYFPMILAIQAGANGDNAKAASIWNSLQLDRIDRHVYEARHWIRVGELERADRVVDKALAADRWNIGAWALRDIIWRLARDERHHWLHGRDGMVQLLPLRDAESVMPAAIETLHRLHETAHMPLGQSLRGGGTQTPGRLFDRQEPELHALKAAIEGTLEDYRQGLPEADDTHPLLRTRDMPWKLVSSWSIRFVDGDGSHSAHLHPEGIISSACYLVLPEDLGAGGEHIEGWIELGRPAPDMHIDLPPLHQVRPKTGHLALFPSTMYHGTRRFRQGRRMTVAFDVQTAAEQ